MKGRPGPVEVLGIYATREELEQAVADMHDAGDQPKQIAEKTTVSSSTIHGILKKYREAKRAAVERTNRELISKAWR